MIDCLVSSALPTTPPPTPPCSSPPRRQQNIPIGINPSTRRSVPSVGRPVGLLVPQEAAEPLAGNGRAEAPVVRQAGRRTAIAAPPALHEIGLADERATQGDVVGHALGHQLLCHLGRADAAHQRQRQPYPRLEAPCRVPVVTLLLPGNGPWGYGGEAAGALE